MNINVRAKFKTKKIAKDVIAEVKDSLEVSDTKLISKESIQNYIKDYYDKKLRDGVKWSASIGSVIGCFLGLGLYFIMASTIKNFSVNSSILILYMGIGLVIGVVVSLMLMYIRRESIPVLSLYDIKENQAIVIFKLSKNKLDRLKEILNSKNVIKYYIA